MVSQIPSFQVAHSHFISLKMIDLVPSFCGDIKPGVTFSLLNIYTQQASCDVTVTGFLEAQTGMYLSLWLFRRDYIKIECCFSFGTWQSTQECINLSQPFSNLPFYVFATIIIHHKASSNHFLWFFQLQQQKLNKWAFLY